MRIYLGQFVMFQILHCRIVAVVYIYIIDLSVFNLLQLIVLLHLLVFQFFLCSYKSDFNNNIYTIKILVYQEKWEYFIR